VLTDEIGNIGYAQEADDLAIRYEKFSFADAHSSMLHLLPKAPVRIIDVGSGTGRDAAALAALGHRVTAVEPTNALLEHAMRLHPGKEISWLSDSLPTLTNVKGQYDVVMLTAVWMHLDHEQRVLGMGRLRELMDIGALLAMTLRHGPVPEGRRMFDVTADETVGLAAGRGLECVLKLEEKDGFQNRPGVRWDRLVFRRDS
jgi:SAM-dependent methyltransferase